MTEEVRNEEHEDDDRSTYRRKEAQEINERLNKQHPRLRLKQGAKIRETYESIAKGIEDESEQTTNVDELLVEKVNEALIEADTLFKKVRESGDSKQLCNDANVLQTAGKVLLKQLTSISLQNSSRVLHLPTYALRMRRYAQEGIELASRNDRRANPLMVEESDDSDDDIDRRNIEVDYSMSKREWSFIGKNLGNVLRNPPGFFYLRPLIKEEEVLPTQHKERKQKAKREEKEARIVVRQREDIEDNNDEVAVSKELALVSKALKRAFHDQQRDKIDYYSFVIDPNDFPKTIENMFYVSFLVKDGRVKIDIVDGLPVLVKLSESEKRYISDNPKSSVVSHQSILSFSSLEWREMKDILCINAPAIPNSKS